MKKLISIILLISILFSFAACGAKNVSQNGKEPEKIEASDPNQTAYPTRLVDQAGREVVIEKEPESIVSCYYISSSLLIALDRGSKMVGIEAKANKRPIYKLAAKELIDLPSVGSAKEFDLEACAALKPDLIILPLKLKDAASKLDELGLKTILVNPENDKLLIEMIDIISVATNTASKANELKDFINSNKDMLGTKLASVQSKNVYLAGTSDVLSTAGKKMYQNSMIELAGGTNVAATVEDKSWAQISYEQLLAWNPECIVIAAEAEYSEKDVLENPVLAECSAVKKGQIYKLPADAEAWDSPVPSAILGSVWLAGKLHADVISSSETSKIIKDFYEIFYGFTYEAK